MAPPPPSQYQQANFAQMQQPVQQMQLQQQQQQQAFQPQQMQAFGQQSIFQNQFQQPQQFNQQPFGQYQLPGLDSWALQYQTQMQPPQIQQQQQQQQMQPQSFQFQDQPQMLLQQQQKQDEQQQHQQVSQWQQYQPHQCQSPPFQQQSQQPIMNGQPHLQQLHFQPQFPPQIQQVSRTGFPVAAAPKQLEASPPASLQLEPKAPPASSPFLSFEDPVETILGSNVQSQPPSQALGGTGPLPTFPPSPPPPALSQTPTLLASAPNVQEVGTSIAMPSLTGPSSVDMIMMTAASSTSQAPPTEVFQNPQGYEEEEAALARVLQEQLEKAIQQQQPPPPVPVTQTFLDTTEVERVGTPTQPQAQPQPISHPQSQLQPPAEGKQTEKRKEKEKEEQARDKRGYLRSHSSISSPSSHRRRHRRSHSRRSRSRSSASSSSSPPPRSKSQTRATGTSSKEVSISAPVSALAAPPLISGASAAPVSFALGKSQKNNKNQWGAVPTTMDRAPAYSGQAVLQQFKQQQEAAKKHQSGQYGLPQTTSSQQQASQSPPPPASAPSAAPASASASAGAAAGPETTAGGAAATPNDPEETSALACRIAKLEGHSLPPQPGQEKDQLQWQQSQLQQSSLQLPQQQQQHQQQQQQQQEQLWQKEQQDQDQDQGRKRSELSPVGDHDADWGSGRCGVQSGSSHAAAAAAAIEKMSATAIAAKASTDVGRSKSRRRKASLKSRSESKSRPDPVSRRRRRGGRSRSRDQSRKSRSRSGGERNRQQSRRNQRSQDRRRHSLSRDARGRRRSASRRRRSHSSRSRSHSRRKPQDSRHGFGRGPGRRDSSRSKRYSARSNSGRRRARSQDLAKAFRTHEPMVDKKKDWSASTNAGQQLADATSSMQRQGSDVQEHSQNGWHHCQEDYWREGPQPKKDQDHQQYPHTWQRSWQQYRQQDWHEHQQPEQAIASSPPPPPPPPPPANLVPRPPTRVTLEPKDEQGETDLLEQQRQRNLSWKGKGTGKGGKVGPCSHTGALGLQQQQPQQQQQQQQPSALPLVPPQVARRVPPPSRPSVSASALTSNSLWQQQQQPNSQPSSQLRSQTPQQLESRIYSQQPQWQHHQQQQQQEQQPEEQCEVQEWASASASADVPCSSQIVDENRCMEMEMEMEEGGDAAATPKAKDAITKLKPVAKRMPYRGPPSVQPSAQETEKEREQTQHCGQLEWNTRGKEAGRSHFQGDHDDGQWWDGQSQQQQQQQQQPEGDVWDTQRQGCEAHHGRQGEAGDKVEDEDGNFNSRNPSGNGNGKGNDWSWWSSSKTKTKQDEQSSDWWNDDPKNWSDDKNSSWTDVDWAQPNKQSRDDDWKPGLDSRDWQGSGWKCSWDNSQDKSADGWGHSHSAELPANRPAAGAQGWQQDRGEEEDEEEEDYGDTAANHRSYQRSWSDNGNREENTRPIAQGRLPPPPVPAALLGQSGQFHWTWAHQAAAAAEQQHKEIPYEVEAAQSVRLVNPSSKAPPSKPRPPSHPPPAPKPIENSGSWGRSRSYLEDESWDEQKGEVPEGPQATMAAAAAATVPPRKGPRPPPTPPPPTSRLSPVRKPWPKDGGLPLLSSAPQSSSSSSSRGARAPPLPPGPPPPRVLMQNRLAQTGVLVPRRFGQNEEWSAEDEEEGDEIWEEEGEVYRDEGGDNQDKLNHEATNAGGGEGLWSQQEWEEWEGEPQQDDEQDLNLRENQQGVGGRGVKRKLLQPWIRLTPQKSNNSSSLGSSDDHDQWGQEHRWTKKGKGKGQGKKGQSGKFGKGSQTQAQGDGDRTPKKRRIRFDGPHPAEDEAPDKFGDTWEEPREETGLQLLGELAPREVSWDYVLNDESRRSFAGYLQNPFTTEQLEKWEADIREGTNWGQPMGKNGPVPRKTAWMVKQGCACTYRYGSIEVDAQTYPQWMLDLLGHVMPLCGLPDEKDWPDSCNMNLYEDGGMTVGWHSDDERLFQGNFRDIRIVSLSFGQRRRFDLRTNWPEDWQEGKTRLKSVYLGTGDIMTMEGMLQKHFQHRVPREEDANEARINLTWRWIVKHTPRCPANRKRQ